jgi:sulfate/thiosulfate transport system ATP-binding protein
MRSDDAEILPQAGEDTTEALVRKIAHTDSEVRVELTLPDGGEISAQLTRTNAQELELAEGQIVTVRIPAARALPPSGSATPRPRA